MPWLCIFSGRTSFFRSLESYEKCCKFCRNGFHNTIHQLSLSPQMLRVPNLYFNQVSWYENSGSTSASVCSPGAYVPEKKIGCLLHPTLTCETRNSEQYSGMSLVVPISHCSPASWLSFRLPLQSRFAACRYAISARSVICFLAMS